MIEASNVEKRYRNGEHEQVVLRGVDLRAEPGEILMLVGPSGSGKTTLLSILGCVLTPTSGSVRLAGQEVAGLPEGEMPLLRRRLVGFIFQSHNLLASLTARQNVEIPLRLRGLDAAAAAAEAQALLERVGLGDRADRLPRQLSGGQRQRVAVARALGGKPPILLADEPTASLDAASGESVLETLRSLARDGGHTVVMVTHDSRVLRFGDRIAHIDDGRIVKEERNVAH